MEGQVWESVPNILAFGLQPCLQFVWSWWFEVTLSLKIDNIWNANQNCLSFLLLFILEGEKKRERERKEKKRLALSCNKYSLFIAPRPLCLLLCRTDKSYADWVSGPRPEARRHHNIELKMCVPENRDCARACVCVCVCTYAHMHMGGLLMWVFLMNVRKQW